MAEVCECLDVRLPAGGCSWLHGRVKIRKRNDDDGQRAIAAAFLGHPSMKHVFVVDEDIDIEDDRQMEWAMATRFQGDRGMVVKPRPVDPAAHARFAERIRRIPPEKR